MAELAVWEVPDPSHQQERKLGSRFHKSGQRLYIPRTATSQSQGKEKLSQQAVLCSLFTPALGPRCT